MPFYPLLLQIAILSVAFGLLISFYGLSTLFTAIGTVVAVGLIAFVSWEFYSTFYAEEDDGGLQEFLEELGLDDDEVEEPQTLQEFVGTRILVILGSIAVLFFILGIVNAIKGIATLAAISLIGFAAWDVWQSITFVFVGDGEEDEDEGEFAHDYAGLGDLGPKAH